MSNTPPNRLSIDEASPFYDAASLERGVGIRFNGRERFDVLEYSVDEGWILVAAGKSLDRRGNPMTLKIKGVVECFYRDAPQAP
jgi:hypothetical protein